MEDPDITVTQDKEQIIKKLAEIIQAAADEAVTEHDKFFIGISGGSMINFLKEALQKVAANYSKWKIFFCDERVVSEDSEDSTFGACKRTLIGAIKGLTVDRFVPMKQGVSLTEAVTDYSLQLMMHFEPGSMPKFDLLLLGLGEDGHTCSLFPGHKILSEKVYCVGGIDRSPKPPPKRITFTLLIINSAARVAFVATGEGKADAVKGVLVDKDKTLPAFLVQPIHGKLYWILDQPAAKLLPPNLIK